MKEKLIELLMSAEINAEEQGFFNCHKSKVKAECIADYLLANGVIPLPCKVGDTVYIPWEYDCTNGVAFSEVEKIVFYTPNVPRIFIKDLESDMPMPSNFCPDDFGKTVFLSREEAEKALKEL